MCNNLCVPREQVQPIAIFIGEFLINKFDDKDGGEEEKIRHK